jgi:D-alanyl-D-alanine carboxypeptidase
MITKSLFIKISLFFLILFFSNSLLAKKAAIIIDFDTQKTLFEVNADTLNFPASLAKIMTLYIMFDYLDKNKLLLNTKMNVSNVASSRSPSKLYLETGTFITVENAIMGLIVKSANDVATVVAEHISGTEREFAKLMTKYAHKIGMKKTIFKNASGLPNRAQLTTARDISILSYKLISNFPEEYKLFKTKKFLWKGKTYKTHNHLMKSYEGADGIKTGYIYASGFQLAFSAVRNNKRLIGVYFGGDTGKQRDRRLAFLMNKVFNEMNITPPKRIIKKKNIINEDNLYKIVVGTFKHKINSEKHLKIIKSKYPKTTNNKKGLTKLIKNKGTNFYESRFEFFTKKEAKIACARLKKYKRDCFIRG